MQAVGIVDAITDQSEEYLDDLWWMLHHSDDEDRIVLGLTSHLDDSGSDDGSALVTCGGPVMSHIQHKAFSKRWLVMYERNQFAGYPLKPPLHMTDFVGMGKYAGLYPEFKRAFFRDVSKLVNEHKLYSISIAISQADFKGELSEDVRKNLIGPYAFAFFTVIAANQIVSEKFEPQTGPLKFAYLVDRGFNHQEQLVEAWAVIVKNEIAAGGFRPTRGLDFNTDDNVPALQAADAIAWASRKKELLGVLPEGFETLDEVLRADPFPPHVTIKMPRHGIKMLADPINKWVSRNGTTPDLGDIIKQSFRPKI